ncbi:unnamed protein product, partial [Clonostachys rhizophaga]
KACILESVSTSDCQPLDIECQCNSQAFQDAATDCVQLQCSVIEALATKNATETLCGHPVRDKSNTLITIAIIFSVLSGCFVLQRFAIKITTYGLGLGIDDWVTLLATLIQAPAAAIACEGGRKGGLGRDIWTLTPEEIRNFGYYLYIYSTIYFLNAAVCKLAFLFFYLRIFPALKVRRVLWCTVIFVLMFGVVFSMLSIFQCRPISHYWNRWDGEHEGTCINASIIAWVNAALSIGLDFFMIGIPLSQIRALHLSRKKKISVGAMFCLGLFVTIISAVRLENLIVHGWEAPNATWEKVEVAVWSTVEINVGIICACLPSLRTLIMCAFSHIRPRSSPVDTPGEATVRNTGFGTTSIIIAQGMQLPTQPGTIHLKKEYMSRD